MFRSARRMAPVLKSLLFGACTSVAPAVVAVPVVLLAVGASTGCTDENDPQTYVDRLDDPRTSPGAVKRLIQFFEDAMTRDKKDRDGPTVKPLLDLIVEPMTKMCTDGDLEEQTRNQLVKFLADARDPRAEACFIKVLTDYKPDSDEENVKWVVRAVESMKLEAAADPVFKVFKDLKASRPKAATIYQDVNKAVLTLLKPAWEADLIALLERPIADLKDTATLKNEAYWQITAAEALGDLKSANAVKPLIKIVLSPLKADMAPTAANALIKIGKPSLEPAIALLNNKDAELMEFSKEENLKVSQKDSTGKIPKQSVEAAEKAHVLAAAIILGTIGRSEAEAPMVAALTETKDDLVRAIIAKELPKLPPSETGEAAFREAYEKTPVSQSIPPGLGAKEALLESSQTYFESSLVPWMVSTAVGLKGDAADVEPVQAASLASAMKLMTKEQISVVDQIYKIQVADPKDEKKKVDLGKGYEKEYKLATELLTACDTKVECYLAKLGDPASQDEKTQFQGIKAAYMAGILGGPEVRQKLIDLMPKITNAAVRYVAVSVIDHHSPKGDPAIADQLQKIVDDAEEAKDSERISANAPFKTIIYRLRARAQ